MTKKSLLNKYGVTGQVVNRKKLHKVHKNWLTIGTAALLGVTGVAFANNANANADTVNTPHAQAATTLNQSSKQQSASSGIYAANSTYSTSNASSSKTNGSKSASSVNSSSVSYLESNSASDGVFTIHNSSSSQPSSSASNEQKSSSAASSTNSSANSSANSSSASSSSASANNASHVILSVSPASAKAAAQVKQTAPASEAVKAVNGADYSEFTQAAPHYQTQTINAHLLGSASPNTPNNSQVPVKVHFIDVRHLNNNGGYLAGQDVTIHGTVGQNLTLYNNNQVDTSSGFHLPYGYSWYNNPNDTQHQNNTQYMVGQNGQAIPNQTFDIFVQGNMINDGNGTTINYVDNDAGNKNNVVSTFIPQNEVNNHYYVGDVIQYSNHLPAGYKLDSQANNNVTSLVLGPNKDTKNVYVTGDPVNYTSNVKVTRDNLPSTTGEVGLRGRVGETVSGTADILPTNGYTLDTANSIGLSNNQLNATLNDKGFNWTNGTPVVHYSANPQIMNIDYVDQSGKQVGTEQLNGKTNQPIALYANNKVQNLKKIPATYTYVPNNNYNIVNFGNGNKTVKVSVQGTKVTHTATVGLERLISKNGQLQVQKFAQEHVPITGNIGDSYTINPKTFEPAGYTTQDVPLKGTIIPDGLGLSEPNVTFLYETAGKPNNTPAKPSNKPARHKNMPTVNNLNDIRVGHTDMYNGTPVTRVSTRNHFKYFMVKRGTGIYAGIHFSKRTAVGGMRRGYALTIPIRRIFIEHSKSGNHKRYQIHLEGRDYYVTARPNYTPNAYLQRRDMHGRHYIKTLRGAYIYNRPRYSRKHRVRGLRRGRVLRIRKIIHISRRGYEQTRFYLGHGRYVTSNKNFVKVV